MDETSTTETTAEQSIRQARLWFKAENLPFPEELLTPAYKPYHVAGTWEQKYTTERLPRVH